MPCDCLAGSPAELSDCRRGSGASPAVKVGELRRQSGSSGRGSSAAARQLSSGSTIHFSARAAGLPPSSPRRMCRTAAEALAAVRQSGSSGSPGSSGRGSWAAVRKLSSGRTIPFSSIPLINMDVRESRPKFLSPNYSQP